MDRCLLTLFSSILVAGLCVGQEADRLQYEGYRLVWEEDFASETPDSTLWSVIPAQPYDWARHMTSERPDLMEISGGTLKLRADCDRTTCTYVTAGLWGKGKQEITLGRIDVRARFDSGQGFWPAIWMLGYASDVSWPRNGEIDIMEHLNQDSIVYQTVHNGLTEREDYAGPDRGSVIGIDSSCFNVYSVVIEEHQILLLVNDRLCHTYPRVVEGEEQFPYPFYLILSAQMGGSWVGQPVPPEHPLTLEIDYIRHYLPLPTTDSHLSVPSVEAILTLEGDR
mgnify:CR=1 FL=1